MPQFFMCELLLVLMIMTVDYINIVRPQPAMSYIMLCYYAFINNVQYYAYAYEDMIEKTCAASFCTNCKLA